MGPKFFVGPGKVYEWSNFQTFSSEKIRFKEKFWKSKICYNFIINSAKVLVLQGIQRKNLHNWKRRWNIYFYKFYYVNSNINLKLYCIYYIVNLHDPEFENLKTYNWYLKTFFWYQIAIMFKCSTFLYPRSNFHLCGRSFLTHLP